MIAMTEEPCIFENEEWLVTESGLEHKTTGYFIDRASVANRRDDGLWTWPLHMAEKSWCAMMPFAEAFSCATSVYDVETGADLARTFKIARCEVAPWPQAKNPAANPAPLLAQTLRLDASDPILWERDSGGKALKSQGSPDQDDNRRRTQTGARSFSVPARLRPSQLSMMRAPSFPWRAPRRIRKTGTRLVRMIQAAWNIR
jgi:hypothetical protein